ncbi:LysR substrate-binding domain-containing protein [Aquabacterium sp. A7-Y]|uniref:LysR substrate-binding domain-containing protein n=1 Tax=Aquabacterium sp. A7-Y TaxID=1349605 RepID=UPI00223CDDBB|nr:LysR substrate-binding domain-containing protein [Aquabacterium sp. A7-Y]MCW7537938.1 LysR substrate-binding domain-containing protein [Aquabacterium sp. A7-Y]
MSRLPLTTLPAFRLVARQQNLRAAAEQLHLTHSAVSQQIRQLEEQLGVELFDRRGRRLVLNAAGTALLRAVEPALALLEDGARAACAAASGGEQRLRVSMVPSFAQRWLLPRMGMWRERHPDIGLEVHAAQHLVELAREGYHVALRQGMGGWRGLEAEPLIDSPLVVLGTPGTAARLRGQGPQALLQEALLGSAALWERWFDLAGVRDVHVNPVATFNDAGLMLQAVEQGLGITLARELLAADALCDGRLVRLSPLSLPGTGSDSYWFVYPPTLRDWPPLRALRDWLQEELERSRHQLARLPAAAIP